MNGVDPMEHEKRVDEEWKKKAKGETPAEGAPDKPSESGGAPMLEGEPSFLALVSSLAIQALIGLGRHPDPVTGSAQVDLPQAQYCIDLLGILEDKTRGNLGDSEARALANTLHELRLLFVESSMPPSERR
jgi:hypothetical protein